MTDAYDENAQPLVFNACNDPVVTDPILPQLTEAMAVQRPAQ